MRHGASATASPAESSRLCAAELMALEGADTALMRRYTRVKGRANSTETKRRAQQLLPSFIGLRLNGCLRNHRTPAHSNLPLFKYLYLYERQRSKSRSCSGCRRAQKCPAFLVAPSEQLGSCSFQRRAAPLRKGQPPPLRFLWVIEPRDIGGNPYFERSFRANHARTLLSKHMLEFL